MSHFLIACDMILAEELWSHFVNKIFLEEMPHYENFSIQSNSLFSLRWLIIGITVGIIIAALVTLYNKCYLGGFVRELISKDCLNRDRAMTLEELGRKAELGICRAIRTGGTLDRWVRCAEEDEFYEGIEKARAEYEEKYKDVARRPRFKEAVFKRNCKTMHFYVPEERRELAEEKFNSKGANWKGILIVIGVAVTFGTVMCYLLPDLLTYVDNFMTLINSL